MFSSNNTSVMKRADQSIDSDEFSQQSITLEIVGGGN
jgi:hypothetical protein